MKRCLYSEDDEIEIETDKTEMDSVSLNLDGIIGLNFYFTLSNNKSPKEIYMNGPSGVKRVNVSDLAFDEGFYKVTYNVAAKNMNDTVSVSVLDENGQNIPWEDDGEQKGVFEYSVMQYLNKAETYENIRLQNLAKAMKAYGIYAQNYFGNPSSEKIPSLQGVNLADYAKVESGHRLANASYYGSSLLLRDTVAIRHYFSISDDINKYTFTVDSNKVKPIAKDGLYYIEIDNIPAPCLAKEFVCTISDGNNEHSIRYSAMSYCQKAISKPGDLGGVVQSLYWYYKYASELFEVEPPQVNSYIINCADGPHAFTQQQYNFIKGFWSYTDDWEAAAHKHTYSELISVCQVEGGIY